MKPHRLALLLGLVLLSIRLATPAQGQSATEPPTSASFHAADLAGADYVLADLRDADLSGAVLTNADLAIADLRGANLIEASLTGARLEAATLRGADLSGANLHSADLSLADLRDAMLPDANLAWAVLHTADLRRADLRNADLTNCDLRNANLDGARLTDVKLTGALFDAHTVWPRGFDPHAHIANETAPPLIPTLRLEMSLSPPVVPLFNSFAYPNDIARTDNPRDIGLLADVTTGQRMAVFKSAALAAQLAPRIADQIDIIGYNLERGPLNPLDEQADPVAATRQLRRVADEHGVLLAIGPDREFALSHGTALAPMADQFVLQIQRVQSQPDVARDFVNTMAETLLAANPDLEISVQVRVDGDPDRLSALIESLYSYIDGVALLTSPDSVEQTTALLTRLRAAQPRSQPIPADAIGAEPAAVQWRAIFLGFGLEVALLLLLFIVVSLIAAVVNGARKGE